jgi:tetratricopeptide (TPR) repeat protein
MDRLIAEANRRLTDGRAIAVTVNGVTDWDMTSRTIAQTWVRQFNEGPLKSLPARAKTPEAPVFETPRGAEIQPSSPEWEAVAASFVSEGKYQQALALLRDQVDADPSDPKARMALSDLYHRLGQPMEAARSAALAAEFAKDPQTCVFSAQRWLDCGDAEQARAALARAVALGASPELVRPHQVTLHLLSGEVAEAEVQLRGLPAGSYPLQRALVEVFGEKPVLGPESAAALGKGPLAINEYSLFVLCLERSLMELTPKIRDLVPRARMEPNSSALLTEAEGAKARLSALSSLVQAIVPPERHEESHESRRLALILLSQSSMVVQAFVRSNDPDQAEEAALSLSEAARIAQAVREAYAAESRRAN